MVDITNLKRAEEERRLVEERYRMVLEQTSDIVFEWDIATDAMTYSKNFLDTFGYVPYEEQGFSRYIRDSKSIHPEDFDAFISVVHKVMAGIPYHEGEFRIRKADGRYLWFRCRTTTQFDFTRRPIKAVGIVMDITAEKERSQKLKERTERDSFTNLYNKASIQSHIEQYLQGEGAGGYHGFLIIDMDHFKDVNDRMGHQSGDTVLLGLAEAIPKLFRGSDLVGRIGGDEFAVFVQSVPNTDFLEQKAKQILDAIRGITLKEDPGYRISCSVGISCYPQNGETFEATYRQADIALYDAKERGRNQFALYHPDMEERVRLRGGRPTVFGRRLIPTPCQTGLRSYNILRSESISEGDVVSKAIAGEKGFEPVDCCYIDVIPSVASKIALYFNQNSSDRRRLYGHTGRKGNGVWGHS